MADMAALSIAFRVDANAQIGTGHFMRCLALARALRSRGALVRVVSRGLPEHMRSLLEAAHCELAPLPATDARQVPPTAGPPHAHWLTTSQEHDAQATAVALQDRAWDWVVVDHYALDAVWERALRPHARHIMVIDDLADRSHDCDLLLDQNLYADMSGRYAGRVGANSELLLGPGYALLREEFQAARQQGRARDGKVQRILVFFGGVDAGNHTARAIAALAAVGLKGLQVDVVIGAQHPAGAEIAEHCERLGYACHVQADNMAALMCAADLGLGAGGIAVWERCCLGLPTLTLVTATNQTDQVARAAAQGYLLAPQGCDSVEGLSRQISALLENPALLAHVARQCSDAVDGCGVRRVLARLEAPVIRMREATAADADRLRVWRNHPRIRQASHQAGEIPREEHEAWLAGVLADVGRVLLIGEYGGAPVGVVRFDVRADEPEAEVSIYLVPDERSAGRGRALLAAAERWLAAERPGVRCIRAQVLGGNRASHSLFANAGYQLESSHYLKMKNALL